MSASPRALAELRAKYAEMLAMRLSHEQGGEDAAEVRQRMGRLAARFPGALRELDDLELAEIRRRLAALEQVLAVGSEPEPWMEATALFHELTRGALAAKRWLAAIEPAGAPLAQRFLEDLPGLPFPEDARAWAGELATLASPPRGRVTHAVFARLAQTLGVSERAARSLVFGPPRRRH